MSVFAWMHVFVPLVCLHRGQKRVLDSLQLDLQVDVSHHVGSGKWTRDHCKSKQQVLLSAELSLQPHRILTNILCY